ncbi:hypothetical protein Pla8534_07000 [Lignipirellula cremea]|uniref:Uncharacterized protein n=1 Tax=Lignipirellula cremea TaxID=2528010 RepID=A0A518DM58_9BACT|nr:hypothetical protein Pla8534_07000 [Lignipirellula cremea]
MDSLADAYRIIYPTDFEQFFRFPLVVRQTSILE